MTEKEALLWVLGVLGSLCAATITIDKVLEIIHKYVKKGTGAGQRAEQAH